MNPKKIIHSSINVARRVTPKFVFDLYHLSQAEGGKIIYKNPSSKMVVIGIVGSKGKTTTANMLWQILNSPQKPAGLIGTADLKIGNKTIPNYFHKTMPGRWYTQQLLNKMAKAGCKYAIMEVPSEGQANWRHVGINFDVLIFTNVTNEILAMHDRSLETLHKHNKRVFKKFNKLPRKEFGGITIPKILIANKDAEHFKDYYKFEASQKYSYSVNDGTADMIASNIGSKVDSIKFNVGKQLFKVPMAGEVNISNAMGAISTAFYLGYELKYIANKLEKFEGVGGRMEFINAKQNFTCIVDYAHEESGMEFLCKWAKKVVGSSKKSIILLGAEGGGRDEKKRPIMGKIAAENCDYLIISNVDPYDDNPKKIITDIVKGAASVRKDLHSVFMIEDRREGIKKALSLAKKGDLVLITGKGSEQSMIIGEKKIKWDDRLVVKEEIKKLLNKK